MALLIMCLLRRFVAGCWMTVQRMPTASATSSPTQGYPSTRMTKAASRWCWMEESTFSGGVSLMPEWWSDCSS
ncbi:hypothetical protein BW737_005600 [Actinomyces ruminis]|uniref:Secreted protein n=1 Tax=Actinomyces ruminis TaxID=1937003 RepID=A0ABX4MC45_9ACTO|nr:hypothetical protein BW737_005600 [Actinomyces ruminis]